MASRVPSKEGIAKTSSAFRVATARQAAVAAILNAETRGVRAVARSVNLRVCPGFAATIVRLCCPTWRSLFAFHAVEGVSFKRGHEHITRRQACVLPVAAGV